jgi:hypothetical protein
MTKSNYLSFWEYFIPVHPFIWLSHIVCIVCPANSSYSFRATALIFYRMFIKFQIIFFMRNLSYWTETKERGTYWHEIIMMPSGGGIKTTNQRQRFIQTLNIVCPANSSYSFRATALIFYRMFIHIMEVCMSTGFWFSSNILKMTGSWT